MKRPLTTLLAASIVLCFLSFTSSAQTGTDSVTRNIKISFLSRDSVNLSLNENFDLIEDSCSLIIRRIHFDTGNRKFFGKFTDVSKKDPRIIITMGSYTRDGLKDGYFEAHYPTGALQAKGNFKDDLLDGKWEFFYENGKPKYTIEAAGKEIKILEAWNMAGIKTADNGTGTFESDSPLLIWNGKLLNGKPEGTWISYLASDRSKTRFSSESFKNSQFKGGSNRIGSYSGNSRMILVDAHSLPFTNTELFRLGPPCDQSPNNFVNARYKGDPDEFEQRLATGIQDHLKTTARRPSEVIIDGIINDRGALTTLKSYYNDGDFSEGLVHMLHRVANFDPATLNGKPVSQHIEFTFTFDAGVFDFRYKFIPLKLK